MGCGLLQLLAIPTLMYARMCTCSISCWQGAGLAIPIRLNFALHVLRAVAQHYRNGSQPAWAWDARRHLYSLLGLTVRSAYYADGLRVKTFHGTEDVL